jgi:hypothetical protein
MHTCIYIFSLNRIIVYIFYNLFLIYGSHFSIVNAYHAHIIFIGGSIKISECVVVLCYSEGIHSKTPSECLNPII